MAAKILVWRLPIAEAVRAANWERQPKLLRLFKRCRLVAVDGDVVEDCSVCLAVSHLFCARGPCTQIYFRAGVVWLTPYE